MKHFHSILLMGALSCQIALAQTPNTWVEKNAPGLTAPASTLVPARWAAVGFGIGSLGYIGTGASPNDFWQYDPATNTAVQKSPLASYGRSNGIGFNIGNLGYAGLGNNLDDFWEYDPVTNAWTQKSSFPGGHRIEAVGFGIGTKGYVGTGSADGGFPQVNYKDFWEYDPATNNWTQKADVGGTERYSAIGFSIGSKGYIGLGADLGTTKNDMWEYNPATNLWTQKANFPSGGRLDGIGFSLGSKGYAGMGYDLSTVKTDLWEFDPVLNSWTQKTDFPGAGRLYVTAFGIGNNGYVGYGTLTGSLDYNDLWEYNPVTDSWIQKLGYEPLKRSNGVGLGIGFSGFIGTGVKNTTKTREFWEYQPATDSWIQRSDFGGTVRANATGFTIGRKGYLGTGTDGTALRKDIWEYDPDTDSWTQKADFGGVARQGATAFSIGNKGYLGGGQTSNVLNDFWEYNSVLNTWTQRANFGGGFRSFPVSFSIGGKGYVGTGISDFGSTAYYKRDLWEYNPATNSWTQKAVPPGSFRTQCVAFNIGDRGYIGTGAATSGMTNEFIEYDPASNTWATRATNLQLRRFMAMGFATGGKGYICCGSNDNNGGAVTQYYDNWEYTPVCLAPLADLYSAGSTTVCAGDSAFLYANSGQNYQWMLNGNPIAGATDYFIYAKTAGNYSCSISSTCSTTTSITIAVQVSALPGAPGSIVATGGNTKVCPGDVKTYTVNAGSGATSYTWTPPPGSTILSGQGTTSIDLRIDPAFPTSDSLRVVSNNACGSSIEKKLKITRNNPTKPGGITTIGGTVKVCPGDVVMYSINPVANATSYAWVAPVGGTVISGQGTTQVTVEYDAGFIATDTLWVSSENACGNSAWRFLKINRSTISTPGKITGPLLGLCNGLGIPYSVTNVAGATYTWTLANGNGTIATGQGTNAITIDFNPGTFVDSLKVTASNGCGTSAVRKVTVKSIPDRPPFISGTTSICANEQDVPFSITPVFSASSYTWIGPSGSHVSDGVVTSGNTSLNTTATAVTIDFAANGGTVKVRALNACGSGSYRSLSVAVTCREPNANAGTDFHVDVIPNPVQDDFTITLQNSGPGTSRVIIRDLRGAEVYSGEFDAPQFTMDARMLSPGVYFAEVSNSNGVEVVRLVKK